MGKLLIFCAGMSGKFPAQKLDHILISAPEVGENPAKIERLKNRFQTANVKILMLDSGGFQIHLAETKNHKNEEQKTIRFDGSKPLKSNKKILNLAPEHVVKAASQIGADIMIAQDYPICKLRDKYDRHEEFMKKLGYNLVWARETAALKQLKCPEMKLLIPIQCYDLDQLETFLKAIEGLKFDGFSMPVRNLRAHGVLQFLVRFHRLGINSIHLLGTLEFSRMAVSAFMSKHFFDWVSLDATTWRIAAHYQNYLNSRDLTEEYIGPNVLIDDSMPIKCKCPWCGYETFTSIKNKDFTEKYNFLASHNFWVTRQIASELYGESDTADALITYVEKNCASVKKIREVTRLLTLVDYYGLYSSRLEELEEKLRFFKP